MVAWISMDSNRKVLEDFVAKRQIPGPHILNVEGSNSDVAERFNIHFTPASFLLDREGKIVAKFLMKKDISTAVTATVKGERLPELKPRGGF